MPSSLGLSGCFGNTACLRRCAPTTARPLPRWLPAAWKLSKWWIRLGIAPSASARPSPENNACIAQRAVRPPARTLSAAAALRWWKSSTQRSHEALGRLTPASVSPRPYPDRLPEVEYPSGVTVRRVRRTGEFKWRGRLIYLSTVLAKETLCPVDRCASLILWACSTSLPRKSAQQWHQRE